MLSVLYCYSVEYIARTAQGDNSTLNESEARLKSVTSQCQWNETNAQYTSGWNTVASFHETITIYRGIVLLRFMSCITFKNHLLFHYWHSYIFWNMQKLAAVYHISDFHNFTEKNPCYTTERMVLREVKLGCYGVQWDVSVSEMYCVYLQ